MKDKKYFAKMSSKGQLTIPSTVRDILEVSEGDILEFDITDTGNITIRKKKDKCKFCNGTGKIEDKTCFICDGIGESHTIEDISQKLMFNGAKYGIGLNIINVVNKDGNIEFLKIPEITVNYNKFNYPEETLNEYTDGLTLLGLSNRGIKIINAESYENLDKSLNNDDVVLLNEVLSKLKSKRMIDTIEEKFNPFMKIYNEFFNR